MLDEFDASSCHQVNPLEIQWNSSPWSSMVIHAHCFGSFLRSLPSEALQHPFVTKRTVAGRVSGGFHPQGAHLSFSRSAQGWWDTWDFRSASLQLKFIHALLTFIDSVLAGLKKCNCTPATYAVRHVYRIERHVPESGSCLWDACMQSRSGVLFFLKGRNFSLNLTTL